MIRKATMLILIAILLAGIVAVPASAVDWKSPSISTLTTQNWKDMVSNATAIPNSTIVLNNGTAAPQFNLSTVFQPILVSGAQSLNFTTSRTGSYLIFADIREKTSYTTPTNSATSVYSEYALCVNGSTTPFPNSERMGVAFNGLGPVNETSRTLHYSWLYTNSTGLAQVDVCGKISEYVDGEWFVYSDSAGRSVMNYMRLP